MLPQAIVVGISVQDFWHMNPTMLKPYVKAHQLKLKEQDMLNWYLGHYVYSAVSTALDNGFNGKKAKSKYIDEPIMSNKYYGLSQEEINELKLQKMIDDEMERIKQDKLKYQNQGR